MALEAHFEQGTLGATIAVTDPGAPDAWDGVTVGAAPSTLTYDNAHAAHGSLAAKLDKPAGGGASELRWIAKFGTQTDHYGRAYVWLSQWPGGISALIWISSPNWRISVNANGTINLQDSAFALSANSTTALPVGQLIRLEWHVVHNATTGVLECKIFLDPDSTTPAEILTFSPCNTGASSAQIRFRNEFSVGTIWFDDIVAAATSYPGPVPAAGPAGVQTIDGLAKASVKTIDGNPWTTTKSWLGIT